MIQVYMYEAFVNNYFYPNFYGTSCDVQYVYRNLIFAVQIIIIAKIMSEMKKSALISSSTSDILFCHDTCLQTLESTAQIRS